MGTAYEARSLRTRTEVWISKAVLYDTADAPEQLVRMKGDGHRTGRCKECAEEIIDRQLHISVGPRGQILIFDGIQNELEEQTPCARFAATGEAILRLESKVRHQ